jgi:hypothetical protein
VILSKQQEVKMYKNQQHEAKINAYQITPASCNYLMGKVVLLIGNDTAVLHTLIRQLAYKGADIALLCRSLSLKSVGVVKHGVESLGRRFLFIEETKSHPITANNLVQTVVSGLGNLDVFIDLSAQNEQLLENKPIAAEGKPNWQLVQAVIKEIG